MSRVAADEEGGHDMTTAEKSDAAPTQHAFEEWLSAAIDERPFELALKREFDQWYATLIDFNITGVGPTPRAAVSDAASLMLAYLHAYFEDGCSFEDALRPVPALERLRWRAEGVISACGRRLSRPGLFGSESTYTLPPGVLSSIAHC